MTDRAQMQSHAPGDRPAPPLQGRTNKTAALDPAPTDPSWPVPAADRVNVRESLFAKAFNRLLQQNLPRADICQRSSKFVANHLRRCGEPTRAQHILFEDRVCSVNFNERYVIAPEIGEVLKHALRIRLVQLGSFHYGMAQHQATIARKVNIDHFNVGIDEPEIVLPCQFTTDTTI